MWMNFIGGIGLHAIGTHSGMVSSQQDIVQNILRTLQAQLQHNTPPAASQYGQQVIGFFHAVQWSQPWLQALVGFHILSLIMVIVLRNRHTALCVYFFIILGLAALSERMNALGQMYWRNFAVADYFDESGLFISFVYAFPLIINGFITLFFILRAAFTTMVEMKRMQLRRKQQHIKKD
ncbi:transmembrane protein 18-domain-containing protein [Radiomyces spectabilis]|uniref:transmembrane protein 18-domain-containing protein n=1 Tax=Radiomyces spectabilis TaxID=64574 RepID=UPI002221241A|nr:transmembrane protein 18-domain-containing protein [Radiomyces spectabilis]KAI8378040.1 transmembrane protein 18-domain-containing protein [Radiomyces spectabilis]